MQIEEGEFCGALERHDWADCVPTGTHVLRAPDEDWSSQLERARRYTVADDTPVIRVDAYDGGQIKIPAGYCLPSVSAQRHLVECGATWTPATSD